MIDKIDPRFEPVTCMTCGWFAPTAGQCHVSQPFGFALPETGFFMGMWPSVRRNDGCGKHTLITGLCGIEKSPTEMTDA